MPLEHGEEYVVLDNAFLYGAANIFYRLNDDQLIRNVNIISLSSLVDALVLHPRLIVDRNGWDYFKSQAPETWTSSVEPLVDVMEFTLPSEERVVQAVAKEQKLLQLCFAISEIDTARIFDDTDITQLYLAYTGTDISPTVSEDELIAHLRASIEFSGIWNGKKQEKFHPMDFFCVHLLTSARCSALCERFNTMHLQGHLVLATCAVNLEGDY